MVLHDFHVVSVGILPCTAINAHYTPSNCRIEVERKQVIACLIIGRYPVTKTKETTMRKLKRLMILSALAFAASTAFAAEQASVRITSPAEGARLDAMTQPKIEYDVKPGPKGDHTHLYVDGKEEAVLRKLKGSYTLNALSPGEHNLCIKVVNKGHTPIGVEQCIKVTVQ